MTLLRVPSLQAVFLRAVKLYNSGDLPAGSTEDMERALAEYLAVFARCLAGWVRGPTSRWISRTSTQP